MRHALPCLALLALALPAAGATARWGLHASTGRIGTLEVRTEGKVVEVDWRVDNNGRGPKVKERIELDAAGLVARRDIAGTGESGAPVKEHFEVTGGTARWTTLDDEGEAPASGALYLDNQGSPWLLLHELEVLRRSPRLTRAALPSGSLRLEPLRTLPVGERKERLEALALWGQGLTPTLLLARRDRLVAMLDPGVVLVEEGFPASFDALSTLARELSDELLAKRSRGLAHRVEGPVWITGARVFDPVSRTAREGQSVVLYRDRIVGLRTGAPPADATVIDARGCTLLPGLFDSHAHLDAWSGLLHLAAGVTFVRDPGNDNQTLLALMPRLEAGELLGPRVSASGFLEGKSPFSASGGFTAASQAEALEKVRWYADHGFWGVKLYNSFDPAWVKPVAAEAHALGLHVSGHVPAFMTSEQAIRDGYDEVNHINQLLLMLVLKDGEDPRTPFRFTVIGERLKDVDLAGPDFQRLLKLVKERKVTLDPTMGVFDSLLLARPRTGSPVDAPWLDHAPGPVQRGRRTMSLDIKPEQYAAYEASQRKQQQVLALLHREGVPLVPGTDDVAGLGLHGELERWVAAGIPAADALAAATLGGARFLGREAELGTIARGKKADLLLVEGDPLEDIHRLRQGRLVVKDGVLFYPDELYGSLQVTPFAPHLEPRPPAR